MEGPPVHKDLRSPSVPARRAASRDFKYYNFKYVKPGQLGAPHYAPDNTPCLCYSRFPPDLSEAPVITLDKRRLYLQAQQWPRPRTYKRSHRDWWTEYKSHDFERRERTIALARDQDGGQVMLEEEMGDMDACDGERDCEVCEMKIIIREGEIAEKVEQRRRAEMESVLDGAMEKYQRKVRRRLEEEGWSYIDVGSIRSRTLDLDWEGATEGWETLSMPD